jgi:demethoxyubiquinone hydroxylase (CLK1/Coq7/Cat5 family)
MHGSSPLPARKWCFDVGLRPTPEHSATANPVALRDTEQDALATLIPLLGCGEEAAVLAFDGLAEANAGSVARYALRAIAAEERVHDALLTGLAARLPQRPISRDMVRAARRFHLDLGRGDSGLHLVRIAATDAAVCMILSRVLREGRPCRSDPFVRATLTRIRNDEARHVSVSRALANTSAVSPQLMRDVAAAARVALANILMLAGDAFDTLKVDPDRLFHDVSNLPDGLIPA